MGTKKQQYSEIDRHIGRQLRARRRELGLSLRELAKSLGISGQQVQKYEEGFNRVSASTLYVLAALLGVPLTFFFAGLRPPSRLRRNKIGQ
jgi:transcriptional regulator with XRE-family HTH domain